MMVSVTDSNSDKESLIGDILCLIGACFYALYVVLLKKLIKDENRMNARRFFGTCHPLHSCSHRLSNFASVFGIPFSFTLADIYVYLPSDFSHGGTVQHRIVVAIGPFSELDRR